MAAPNQGNDPTLMWGLLAAIAVCTVFSLWLALHSTLGPMMIEVKRAELWLMTFVSKDASDTYTSLTKALQSMRGTLVSYSGAYSHKQMWDLVVKAGEVSGSFYRWPVGLMMLGMIIYIYIKFPLSRFKTIFNLDTLIAAQSVTWPVIKPFINYNPTKGKSRAPGARMPTEMPLFGEAMYPEEWMAFHRIRLHGGVPDRDQIRRCLLQQLGPIFNGLDQLPDHLYCLMAAFALKGARKRDQSDDLLGQLAGCWSSEHGLRINANVKAIATKVLSDRKLVEPLLEVVSRHAYVATAMVGALAWARREGGVLAPAQFVWLRGEHREMWYPLNNIGRRSFHVEASGAMGHYQAELEANRRLVMPRVDAAVVAIVQYLSETRARIPELDSAGEVKKVAHAGSGKLQLSHQK